MSPDLPAQMKALASDPLLNEVDAEPILVEGEPRVEIANGAIDHDIDLITVVMRERNRLVTRICRFDCRGDRGRIAVRGARDQAATTRFR